jgi:murein L,D-transpeptidase YafK
MKLKWSLPALCVASSLIASPAQAQQADLVVVSKAESRLYLQHAGKRFASFKVAFGAHPQGHKHQEGDERTPQGKYVLDAKNPNSRYYKAIHISYPNAQDRAAAKARGVSPGGQVMIHGQRNGLAWLAPIAQLFDWTDGCIALSNADMETVWKAVDVGTPIQIDP